MPPDQIKDNWLDTAVSGIKFGPDQRAVRRELAAHLEDKTLDLRRIFPDMTEEEAQGRALASMGDAEEIKVELAKVHRPWLGYLWALSNLLLLPVLLSGMFVAFLLLISLPDWEAREVILRSREIAWSEEVAARSVPMKPDGQVVRMDDCLLTMERAWLVAPEDPEDEYCLQVELRLLSPLIWVERHYFFEKVQAADSGGNTYAALESWVWSDARPERWVDGGMYPWSQSILPRLFQERYVLTVGGVDPDVEWVQLEYSWMDRSFAMRVEREGT